MRTTRRERAIAFLEKQRNIEIQMMQHMKEYVRKKDPAYEKIRNNHLEKISLIDYILMRL